jgi:hypothetical protein
MKRVAVLLVALSAVLAGCGGSGGPTTTSPGPMTQVDPPETTAGTPTVEPPDGPVGIEDGAVDERSLVAGHAAALQPHSYRFTLNQTANDSFRQYTSAGKLPLRTHITKPSASADQYYVRMSEVGMDRTGVMNYANTTAGGGQYVTQAIPGELGPSPATRRLVSFVEPMNLTADGTRTVDGREYRVLTASGIDDLNTSAGGARPPRLSEVTGFEATVLVDQRGFIYSVNATYEYPDDTRTVRILVDQLDSATIEEPSWLCDARAQTRFDDDC